MATNQKQKRSSECKDARAPRRNYVLRAEKGAIMRPKGAMVVAGKSGSKDAHPRSKQDALRPPRRRPDTVTIMGERFAIDYHSAPSGSIPFTKDSSIFRILRERR